MTRAKLARALNRAMFKEVEDEINNLPPQFFGTVEVTFQAAVCQLSSVPPRQRS
jgi:hypothetical protein